MPRITYFTPDGEEIEVEAEGNLMTAALTNFIDGIDGDCGGVCSCATCHVHIDPAWIDKVGRATEIEQGMLELEDNVTDCSRLGCQVDITDDLEGLVVRVVGR